MKINRFFKSTLFYVLITSVSCGNPTNQNNDNTDLAENQKAASEASLVLGADRPQRYLSLLDGKKVGVVGNQTTVVGLTGENANAKEPIHFVDALMSQDVEVVKVFAPEHGFRGTADAGEVVEDGKDQKTGLPILSLYGNNKKPSAQQLEGIDVLIFDIQDVGTRFYTYISTLHYIMESAAENDIPLIVMDRPNPNGSYIDGPILDMDHKSFVGMHPIPIVHGLTIGEYAKMVNGEGFLKDGIKADLTVIEMENYNHDMPYDLPIKPSPNLPNATSINLYPSLCFFEGTNVNEGRGTDKQFQVFGSPYLDPEVFDYSYVPEPNEGSASPKHLGKTVYGMDLSQSQSVDYINLEWLIKAYNNTSDQSAFFNAFFTKLAGTTLLQEQIEAGMSSDEIRKTWESGLEAFAQTRDKYLLYE